MKPPIFIQNCPSCDGSGWFTRDVARDHPAFGKREMSPSVHSAPVLPHYPLDNPVARGYSSDMEATPVGGATFVRYGRKGRVRSGWSWFVMGQQGSSVFGLITR